MATKKQKAQEEKRMAGFYGFDLGCSYNPENDTVSIVIVGEEDERCAGYVAQLDVDPERAIQLAELILSVAKEKKACEDSEDEEDEGEN